MHGPHADLRLLLALACWCSSACTGPNKPKSILFTTDTSFGLELSAAEANKQGVALGYERFAGVVMPVVKEGTEEEPGELLDEAYSVLALYDMDTGSFAFTGLGTLKITQVFATGRAATEPTAATAVATTFGALADIPAEETIVSAQAIQVSIDSIPEGDGAVGRVWAVLDQEPYHSNWTQKDGEGLVEPFDKNTANAKAAIAQIANRAPELLNELAEKIEDARRPL